MRTIKLLCLIVAVLSLQSCCFYGGCDDDFITDPDFQSAYEPVYLDRTVFEESVELLAPRDIVNSGKIYVYNKLLLVNEKNEGFHVIDNANPSNPQPLGFVAVPGSSDVAIKEDVLYINQAVDLIAITIDIQSQQLTLTKRVQDIFPVLSSPEGFYPYDVPENTIVIDWQLIN